MMSIPASKGFEIGEGFSAATMQGDNHNDLFTSTPHGIQLESNHAGGTLGGISTGAPVYGRVAFKPTSSIRQAQMSTDIHGQPALFQQPETARHDPCVAIRAVPVVQAMCAVTLVDAFLMQRLIRGV
jgi:chorismate synthase